MTVNGADRSFATASPTCRCAPTVVDDTVIVHGRLAVVVVLLPREPGPRLRAHPQYEAPRRRCRCPGCRAGYARTALTAMCQRQRSARQSQARHSRCAWRRDRGAAESRDVLMTAVIRAERHALGWALPTSERGR